MPNYLSPTEREQLLADVAEMYYLQGKRQSEIGELLGVTASMVSRLLTQAHQHQVVQIRIRRPLQSDVELEAALAKRFQLEQVKVVIIRGYEFPYLKYLGGAAAQVFKHYLEPGITVGIAWGTTLSALVDEIELENPQPVKLVELVGALGSRNSEYEGHGIVTRLAQKLGGEHYFLNAPFVCANAETAQLLMKDPILEQPLALARQAQIALLGTGSLQIPHATVHRFGYFSAELIEELRRARAVGNVCGLYFDIHGQEACSEFCQRLVTISKPDLLKIPIRLGVAGGPDKAEPILGALRGGYFNVLVTDNLTARRVLQLSTES